LTALLGKKSAEILEHKLSHLTGKTYPVGIEQFLLHRERKQGIEEGILKKTIEMVLSLFDDGFHVEIISKHTKLSTDEVLDILRKNDRI
jgi:predicted transposase/invertase (TIGR01784 family)